MKVKNGSFYIKRETVSDTSQWQSTLRSSTHKVAFCYSNPFGREEENVYLYILHPSLKNLPARNRLSKMHLKHIPGDENSAEYANKIRHLSKPSPFLTHHSVPPHVNNGQNIKNPILGKLHLGK